MEITAAAFLICSVTSPIIGKKRPLTIIASALCGVVGGAYLAFCPAMLYELESNGYYTMPTDYFSGSHTTYTVIFMVLIYSIALIGAALPILCRLKQMNCHKNKLFNIYAIVSAVSFATFCISLFTSYAQYSNLVLFLPLHFAFPLFVSALSMLECKIPTQFTKAMVSMSVMIAILLGEMILINSVSVLTVILGVIMFAVPSLGMIAVFMEKRSAKSSSHAVTLKGK